MWFKFKKCIFLLKKELQKYFFSLFRFVPQSAHDRGFSLPRKYDGGNFRGQPGKIEDYTLGRGVAAQPDSSQVVFS